MGQSGLVGAQHQPYKLGLIRPLADAVRSFEVAK